MPPLWLNASSFCRVAGREVGSVLFADLEQPRKKGRNVIKENEAHRRYKRNPRQAESRAEGEVKNLSPWLLFSLVHQGDPVAELSTVYVCMYVDRRSLTSSGL